MLLFARDGRDNGEEMDSASARVDVLQTARNGAASQSHGLPGRPSKMSHPTLPEVVARWPGTQKDAAMFAWVCRHEPVLWWLGALSVGMFVATLVALPLVIARLPPDYFTQAPRSARR